MRPDYSAIERAGQARGMGISSLGQGIGNALESIGEMKKLQKQEESQIAVAENIAKLLESKAPGLVPGAGELAVQMADTNIPRQQRLGTAQYILNALSLGTKIQEEQRQQEMLGLSKAKLAWEMMNSGQGEQDPTSGYFDFGGGASSGFEMPQGSGVPADGMVLPPKGGVPSNGYVDSLDPNMIQY